VGDIFTQFAFRGTEDGVSYDRRDSGPMSNFIGVHPCEKELFTSAWPELF